LQKQVHISKVPLKLLLCHIVISLMLLATINLTK